MADEVMSNVNFFLRKDMLLLCFILLRIFYLVKEILAVLIMQVIVMPLFLLQVSQPLTTILIKIDGFLIVVSSHNIPIYLPILIQMRCWYVMEVSSLLLVLDFLFLVLVIMMGFIWIMFYLFHPCMLNCFN